VKRCGAKTRAGGQCQQPAGFGTVHVGGGRCKFHGGTSPGGRKAGQRDAALAFARGALGAQVAASPIDTMEQAVRLTAGLIACYRHELADAASRKAGCSKFLGPSVTSSCCAQGRSASRIC
jgi:hypothetical protein